MIKILHLLAFVILSNVVFGQLVTGYIYDSQDQKPIPFAVVVVEGTTQGTTSDIDGFFYLTPQAYPVILHVHALGYSDTLVTLTFAKKLKINLTEKALVLAEAVIVPGENPAIPIIKKAIANRHINNPEKNHSFTYKTYSKMVFGPNVEDADQDIVLSDSSTSADSSNYEFQQAMQQHYLFITESVTERKHLPPNKTFENVIANRFSGLKNPKFTMIATEFQPFSYYSDYVDIIGLKYLSPLARNSYKDYVFELKDTLFHNSDTIYRINFQPRKGHHFNGLIGTMSINSNGYAIQNINVKQANPTSTMQIGLEQMSEFIDGKQWFPVQFNTHIVFKMSSATDDDENDLLFELFNAVGKTYVKDIVVDADLSPKDFPNVELDLDQQANKKGEEFWEQARKKQLTHKEETTYVVIDSLGEELNFDKKLLVLEALTTGLIPMGPVSFELDRFFDYNEFEGIRLGVGMRTNDRFAKFMSVGAYAAYGFNDVHWKYGGDIKFNISRKNDITAGLKYLNDVTPSGGVGFFKPNAFQLRSYSDLYITRMDRVEGIQAYVTFRALGDFQNKLFFNYQSLSHNYPFVYAPVGDTVLTKNNTFQRAEIGWSFRFGLKERYIRTFDKNVSLGTKFPYLWVRLAHGNQAFGGTYNYTKLDARISRTYLIKGFGKFGFQFDAGTTVGDVPSTLLHYGRGMRVSGFNLYIQDAFNTMAPNEFISQNYVSGHIHHRFGPLYKLSFSAPEISIVSSASWGTIDNTSAYLGNDSKTMEKGFFESGLLFDNLIISNTSGVGFGVFYRYGPYALPEIKDNFGFSFTILYVLQ